jgi:hypothetical protein
MIKRIVFALFAMLLFSFPCHAFLGLINKDDLQLVKNEIKADKNESNVFKAELSGKVVGLESKIDKIEMKMDAQVSAIAGFNNQVNKMQAGGNIINNDTSLIKFIFDKWGYFLGAFLTFLGSALGSLWGVIKYVMLLDETRLKDVVQGYKDQLDAKQLWIDNLSKANDAKETKMDAWQQMIIEKQINGKNAKILP